MSHLVLLFGAASDAPIRWACGDGATLSASGTAPDVAGLAGRLPPHDRLIAVLPGEVAATRRLRLPVSERQTDGAARLALEDVLAEPADGFALAWTPAVDGERLVSAVPRAWLDERLATLSEAGLDPDVVTVDHAALGADGHNGVVLREGERVVAALPSGGLTASEHFALPLIERLAGDASLLAVRIGPSGAEIGSESLVLADERALSAFYLASTTRSEPPNFRRGKLAKRRNVGAQARGWRLAGGLMAACLTLWLISGVIYGLRYQGAADRLMAEAETAYLDAFPGSRILNLRRQAEQRAAAPGGSLFLPLSAALAGAMEETGEITLSGLSYTADGELIADVRYRDFGELERLSQNLRARGLGVQEGASPRRGDDGSYADQITLVARRGVGV